MLQLRENLLNRPVMSLRTGGQIATALEPVINPNNLKIEGFYCEDKLDKRMPILLTQDIRDILPQGYVVNDHDALSDPEELIRLKETLEIGFQLVGKQVVTVEKTKVGKVTDWAAESSTFYIQKLYVGQSLLKSLSSGQLSIDRSNIVEITNKKIIINEILTPTPTKGSAPVTAPAS